MALFASFDPSSNPSQIPRFASSTLSVFIGEDSGDYLAAPRVIPQRAAELGRSKRVFSELSPVELRDLETALKRVGRRAAGLMEKS